MPASCVRGVCVCGKAKTNKPQRYFATGTPCAAASPSADAGRLPRDLQRGPGSPSASTHSRAPCGRALSAFGGSGWERALVVLWRECGLRSPPRPQNSLPNSHSDLLTGGSASSMRSHRGMYGYVGSLGSAAFLAVERGCTRGSVARQCLLGVLPCHCTASTNKQNVFSG